MQFVSTRNPGASFSIDDAVKLGLAPDGGLFAPAQFPLIEATPDMAALDYAALAAIILRPFFDGSELQEDLHALCSDAFNFPAPLVARTYDGAPIQLLELFHGPTAAFKDFGARFLARCLERLNRDEETRLTILAATSGDTGGAVAAAVANTELFACLLFPKDGVSPLQERQLCCWPDNILSLRVDGDFDACQAIVKEAFLDQELRAQMRLSSANSINIARLLAQSVYYWHSSLAHQHETHKRANFIIPTGNLGNALACIWARRMGAPIGRVHIAVNANRTLADYAATGDFKPRPSVKTLSNAMDVGAPSNFERLQALLGAANLATHEISVSTHSDKETKETIQKFFDENDAIICPHTAIGVSALSKSVARDNSDWIIAATAHPAKFNDVIKPVIGVDADMPPSLSSLQSAPISVTDITADYKRIKTRILSQH